MMKQLFNEQSADSLFFKLTISSNSKYNKGLLLLSKLLASESTPFRKQYIKYCREYTIFTFLTIQKYSKNWKNLDLSQIISADCMSASQIKFHAHEQTVLSFLKEKKIFPIVSSNFKPSQWSLETFFNFVRESVDSQLETDWSSWCGDVDLTNDHFHPNLWNSNDKLWRLLNYKCIERMNQSKRITVRWKFLSIFKPKNDSAKEALMKIISIAAAYGALKDLKGYSLQEKQIIESKLKDLFENITIKRISRVAARLIKYCGLKTKYYPISSTKFLPEIYALLHNEPSVNSSWLLNLIYLTLRTSNYAFGDEMIDWFFTLSPSIVNICQILEIASKFRPKLGSQVIQRLNHDNALLQSVYKECPVHFKGSNSIIPLKNRIKLLLSTQLKFPKQTLELKIPYAQKDQFWYLLRIIIEKENTIFIHNNVIFKEGFDLFTFKSLDHFFEHFLETFMAHFTFYHNIGNEADGRPVIIPSIRLPEKVIQILVSVLARSAVLHFKVPFHLYFDLFKTALDESKYRFQRLLKIQKEFYNYPHLTDENYAKDCDHINRNEKDLNYLVDYLKRVSSEFPSLKKVPQWTVLKLIESHQRGIRSAIKSIFPSEAQFNIHEIYSLIFNRK